MGRCDGRLVLQRLQGMDRGETVRLRASHDLLPIWLRQHGREPGGHVWVYEQRGPTEWIVHITRCDGQAR